MLGGTDPSETGRTATRFTVSHLARLRGLFQDWIDGARYVEGVYATLARSSDFPADATVATKALVALSPSVALRKYGGGSVQALAVAKGLRSSLANSIPLADKNSRSAIFDGKNSSRPRAYAEAMRFTWLRPVLKRVVLGYIEGDQHAIRAKNVDADGLRSEEFTQVAVDIWPILKDFKYVGRRNVPEEDAEKRFREAALFASGSDGNDIFSVDEGVQLVLLMLSAGPLATDFRIRIEAICQNGELDDYARPSIEPVCYRRTFYDFSRRNTRMADLWEAFPRLIDFYEGLSEERKAEFAGYVEIASRKPGYDESTWFASDESQTTVMLFHYMENLLARFDSSKDGNVDQDEAKSAFPIFRTTLAPVANLPETDAKLESVFTWLLAKGGPPVSDDMNWFKYGWKSGAFLSWHWRSPDFTADRLALMRVFATLMSALSPPPPAEAPAPAQR